MSTESHKTYTIVPFPWIRAPIVDSLHVAQRKPLIHALVEVDVTIPRQYLSQHKHETGESLSFTAFIIACIAKALEEHKEVQAYRRGRRRLILFEDVDVCTLVEHDVDGGKVATPFVIRAANRKTFRAIHQEIRAAQAVGVGSPWAVRVRRLYPYVPRLLRMAFWSTFDQYPRLRRRIGGTVVVTAVGMFGKGAGWGIPITDYTLAITLGGIGDKPGVVDGRIEVRQSLCVTVSVDHTIVDGAPLARFLQRAKALIESGDGLEGGLECEGTVARDAAHTVGGAR